MNPQEDYLMGDVISFTKAQREVRTVDENDVNDIDNLVDVLAEDVAAMLDEVGFNSPCEETAKDFYYLIEAMRSMIERQVGIEHPFQSFIDETIDCRYDEGDELFYVNWKDKYVDKKEDDE